MNNSNSPKQLPNFRSHRFKTGGEVSKSEAGVPRSIADLLQSETEVPKSDVSLFKNNWERLKSGLENGRPGRKLVKKAGFPVKQRVQTGVSRLFENVPYWTR